MQQCGIISLYLWSSFEDLNCGGQTLFQISISIHFIFLTCLASVIVVGLSKLFPAAETGNCVIYFLCNLADPYMWCIPIQYQSKPLFKCWLPQLRTAQTMSHFLCCMLCLMVQCRFHSSVFQFKLERDFWFVLTDHTVYPAFLFFVVFFLKYSYDSHFIPGVNGSHYLAPDHFNHDMCLRWLQWQ